jgi:hypothetical protein
VLEWRPRLIVLILVVVVLVGLAAGFLDTVPQNWEW